MMHLLCLFYYKSCILYAKVTAWLFLGMCSLPAVIERWLFFSSLYKYIKKKSTLIYNTIFIF